MKYKVGDRVDGKPEVGCDGTIYKIERSGEKVFITIKWDNVQTGCGSSIKEPPYNGLCGWGVDEGWTIDRLIKPKEPQYLTVREVEVYGEEE